MRVTFNAAFIALQNQIFLLESSARGRFQSHCLCSIRLRRTAVARRRPLLRIGLILITDKDKQRGQAIRSVGVKQDLPTDRTPTLNPRPEDAFVGTLRHRDCVLDSEVGLKFVCQVVFSTQISSAMLSLSAEFLRVKSICNANVYVRIFDSMRPQEC